MAEDLRFYVFFDFIISSSAPSVNSPERFLSVGKPTETAAVFPAFLCRFTILRKEPSGSEKALDKGLNFEYNYANRL
jgi:hypothetical protein